MSKVIRFSTDEREEFTIVEFTTEGVITPSDLGEAVKDAPVVDLKKGVVISGRGPIWLHAGLVHYYHPAGWVATYDPRLGGVVVQSHVPDVKVGEVVEC